MKKRLCFTLLFLTAMFAMPLHLLAQATASGAVTGAITDPSQAVINGASVTIVSLSTDAKRTTITNTSGGYRFDLLSAGSYKLTVSSTGFSTVTENVELLVGQTVSANITLHPGATTQTVEVAGENPLIDTTKTSVSAEITPDEVVSLPMVGQDVADLAYLAPGVDRLLRPDEEPLRDSLGQWRRRPQRECDRKRRRQQGQHRRRSGDAASDGSGGGVFHQHAALLG